MKAYLQFGDWSEDGHCRYENVLVEINTMENLLQAQKDIKAKYGETFFEEFAQDNPSLSPRVWGAFIAEGMSVSLLAHYDTYNDWSDFWEHKGNIIHALHVDSYPLVSIEFVEHAFIWLLNKYGANITILPENEDIPRINNWTCPGFQNVGYGCFYD